MKLDESWKEEAKDLSFGDKDFLSAYMYGASDFQQKAIEELEKLSDLEYKEHQVRFIETLKAIKIIKELKAN